MHFEKDHIPVKIMPFGRVLRLRPKDIFTNLALEDRLFRLGPSPALLFYVNRPCAVLGRTQNPFVEVDVAYAAEHNVAIARRRSGGGCVVHDGGNLNFCFVRPRSEHSALANAEFVAEVLRDSFGVPALVNERADIIVDGKKISGAAYRITGDRAYHHGTLLVRSDLSALSRVLRAPLRQRLKALGTKSVSSPVANIADYHPNVTVDDVVAAIAEKYGGSSENMQIVDEKEVELSLGGVAKERELLASHSWVFGQIPKFSFEDFDENGLTISAAMEKGAVVTSMAVTLAKETHKEESGVTFLNKMAAELHGSLFDGSVLAKRLEALRPQFVGTANESIANLFISRLRNEIPRHHWCHREAK